jgi:PIN domain nuclease of toxin-antitoxin system
MELIVKAKKGRLVLDPDPLQWWKHALKVLGYPILPVRQNHVERLWALPLLHKDPSDRLLIAQAMAEGIPLVTPDVTIRQYPVEAIW